MRPQENREYRSRLAEVGAHGRDSKRLDGRDTNVKHAVVRPQENREYRSRLAEAGAHGRDSKRLDAETEEKRSRIAERVAEERAAVYSLSPHVIGPS